MIQRRNSQLEQGPAGASQQSAQIESVAASQSSSVGSARHAGHSQARAHDTTQQPQRSAEQYTAGRR